MTDQEQSELIEENTLSDYESMEREIKATYENQDLIK